MDRSLRTYFHPSVRLVGGTEHAMRMPFVAHEIKTYDGEPAFNKISIAENEQTKLGAIRAFSETLHHIQDTDSDADDLFGEYLLACKIRFAEFAVEDTDNVSKAMQDLILQLYKATSGLRQEHIEDARAALVVKFCDLAGQNYEDIHPGSNKIPNRRAIDLLREIVKTDENLKKSIAGRDPQVFAYI